MYTLSSGLVLVFVSAGFGLAYLQRIIKNGLLPEFNTRNLWSFCPKMRFEGNHPQNTKLPQITPLLLLFPKILDYCPKYSDPPQITPTEVYGHKVTQA